jgi:hypothetical protein
VVVAPYVRAVDGSSGAGLLEGLAVAGVTDVRGTQRGLSIALVNYARELQGVQIGLINIARNKERFRVLPIVNWN